MIYLENIELYQSDLLTTIDSVDLTFLKDKSILISGATGMIGKFMIDVIMKANELKGLHCTVVALGRNYERAKDRFGKYFNNSFFKFEKCDVNQSLSLDYNVDYVIHGASNTHPLSYSTDPVGTIMTNIIGTKNMLDYAVSIDAERFLFLSTVEIYGENSDVDYQFDENSMGYIDCNTLRAGYNESKRVGEALCQAYREQYGLDVVIPRIARVYGPSMLLSDSKAMSQFIKNVVFDEDIILKSSGTQFFSYVYVSDAVAGILFCLNKGKNGEAYNIANSESNITLKDAASILANFEGKNVVFGEASIEEKKGYSTASVAILDTKKIEKLGYRHKYSIEKGLIHTVKILKEGLNEDSLHSRDNWWRGS